MRGLFFTFEGVEGSGKSTQAALLRDGLAGLGYPVRLTREPGGTPFAERTRSLLLDPPDGEETPAEAELFLFLAARADHVRRAILPALRTGTIVIADRFSDATIAYQGHGRGLPVPAIEEADRLARGGLVPDRTFLLDLPAEAGLARIGGRVAGPDRLEREDPAFHRRVREGYLALARDSGGRILVLKADEPVPALAARILSSARELLEGVIPGAGRAGEETA